MDGLPCFLNYGAPRARAFGMHRAPILTTDNPVALVDLMDLGQNLVFIAEICNTMLERHKSG